MKTYLLLIAMLVAFVSQAADLTVNLDGKEVVVQYRALDREISERDRNTGNQGGPVECSLLYYSLLAKGDIEGASKLATDPAGAAAMSKQYRERLGAADFQKEMAAYFTSKNRLIGEFSYGDEVMLLLKTPDYTAGQISRVKDGKHFVVVGRPMSDASRVLGKVLNQYKEGKIKL